MMDFVTCTMRMLMYVYVSSYGSETECIMNLFFYIYMLVSVSIGVCVCMCVWEGRCVLMCAAIHTCVSVFMYCVVLHHNGIALWCCKSHNWLLSECLLVCDRQLCVSEGDSPTASQTLRKDDRFLLAARLHLLFCLQEGGGG